MCTVRLYRAEATAGLKPSRTRPLPPVLDLSPAPRASGTDPAPAHSEVRRCARRLRDAMRDLGTPAHTGQAGAKEHDREYDMIRGITALAVAPKERTHTQVEVILAMVRSTGFHIKSHVQMQNLCRIARHVSMQCGGVVCREGDEDCDIYIIVQGCLSVMVGGEEVAVLTPGRFFGERGLLQGTAARTATVVCSKGNDSGHIHLLHLRADELNACKVDLELIFGRAKDNYREEKLKRLKRLEMKLSAAMAQDPPPHDVYASHREWLERDGIVASKAAFDNFDDGQEQGSTTRLAAASTPASKQRMQLLSQVQLFKQLSNHDLLQLSRALAPVVFEKGDLLMKEGDTTCDSMFVVSHGEASVSKKGQGVVAVSKAGEAIGETALLTDDPRNATVIATTERLECLELLREDFDKYLFGKIKFVREESGAQLRRFRSLTKVQSIVGSGSGDFSDTPWTAQHPEDRLQRWTAPLIIRASARARLGEFDGAMLDVVETLRIQPRHQMALAMRPKLLEHMLQHRERAAADCEILRRSLSVADHALSRSDPSYLQLEFSARSDTNEQTLQRSERSLALHAKLKQEVRDRRLLEEEKARKQLEASAEAAKKPAGNKKGPVAVDTKKKKKKKKKTKKGTAKGHTDRQGNEQTKKLVLRSLDASWSAAAQREMRASRRRKVGQYSCPDLRWQAPFRDGPALIGPGGASKRCVKVVPAAEAVGSELGSQPSDSQPDLAVQFRSSCDSVARDRPYAQFWRSVKFTSAVFSPWTGLDTQNRFLCNRSSGGHETGGNPGEPSPSHWDYVMGRVSDIVVDEVDARATRRRLLRMIELLTQVFAYYTRLSPDAAEPPYGPRILETWSDGRRVEMPPANIHPSRLALTDSLGCLWYDVEPPSAAGRSIPTSWSQASMDEMNSTIAERSALSHSSPSGTPGWDSDDIDGDADEFAFDPSADAGTNEDGSISGKSDESSDESSDAEQDKTAGYEETITPLAPVMPLYEVRPVAQLEMFGQHPWPPKGSKPMLVNQARRVITKLYEEKVQADEVDDRQGNMRQSFPSFIWDHFETRYGLKKIAQKKMGELINSVRKFAPTDDLLKVFGSLSGILDDRSYSACSCDFVLDFIGSIYPNHEAIDELLNDAHSRGTNMVDIVVAMEAVTANYELRSQVVPPTLRDELLQRAEDHEGEMCICIEVCLDVMYTTWLGTMQEGDAVLEATFKAFDKNHDGQLSLQEFAAIVREVELLRYGDHQLEKARTEQEVMKMYQHAIDESGIGNNMVSLDGFLTVARFYSLGVPVPPPVQSSQVFSGPLAAIAETSTMSQAELEALKLEKNEQAEHYNSTPGQAEQPDTAEKADFEAIHAEISGPELPYDRPDTVITLQQMHQFALDCEAIGPSLSAAGLGRICHTVYRNPLPEDSSKHTTTLRQLEHARNNEATDIHNPETELHVYEFVESVLRISCNTYGGAPTDTSPSDSSCMHDISAGQMSPGANVASKTPTPCADCFESFLVEHVLPHSCTHDTTRPLRWIILEPKCRAVVATYMPGLEQTFCSMQNIPTATSGADFVDDLPEAVLNAAANDMPTRAGSEVSATHSGLKRQLSRSNKSILQKQRDAIVVVENIGKPVSDSTVQLNQLLAFNQRLSPKESDGRGFFDPNMLVELWRDVTMQPGGVARVSAQNVHAEMTLSEWCEFVCLLALKTSDCGSPRGARQRTPSDTIQRFMLRVLFPLVSDALAVPTDKLSETAEQRKKLDSKTQRVALAGMLNSGHNLGSDSSFTAAIRVDGLPRRLSTAREITEEERLTATRERIAATQGA